MDVTRDHHSEQNKIDLSDKHLLCGWEISSGYIKLLRYGNKSGGTLGEGRRGREGEDKENVEVSVVNIHDTLEKDCLYETTEKENME